MSVWEILLLGVALSMDAVAAGMTDGMTEPRMLPIKAVFIAFAFGLFQFLMPLVGYYCGYAFAELVGKIAPWLSFVLLGFLGGKMLLDGAKEDGNKTLVGGNKTTGAGKVLVQAVATSIDALAVGVTLLATETLSGLPDPVYLCALLIGETTAALSLLAIAIGKRVGNKLADRAEFLGGAILLLIGVKILLESFV
ncbi:MAG: manganese efflux pump MntP family protein [Clostridiales bacterium]|nr:manganese efflux pump MntP family protein [Clostridiales bacterium]